jgi:hypothetical protein
MANRVKLDMRVLQRLDKEAPGKARAVVRKVAIDIQAAAQQNAPVLSGNLKSNIHARELNATTWRVSADTEYAAPVEYGHIAQNGTFVSAQLYFEPAIEQIAGTLPKELKAVVIP